MEQRMKRGFSRKAAFGGMVALGALALTGCEVAPPEAIGFLDMGWPEPVTPEAEAMYNFWIWVWVAAWIIGIIMWALFLTAIVRWNRKAQAKKNKDEFPRQTQYNVPLELVLTGVPIIIVMVLFFFTVQTQTKVVALDKDPEVTVDVTGFQWNWKFGYAHVDGSFVEGGQDYGSREIDPEYGRPVGTDAEAQRLAAESAIDPDHVANPNPIHGKSAGAQSYLNFNEIETVGTTEEVPVLVVPADTPVEFRLASGDVSHGFWIPHFLFKRDVYAHPENNQQQRAFQVESIDEGSYVGRCAEMCGTYHAMMNFELRALPADQFADYIQYRIDNEEATNSEALAAVGAEPYATTTHPFNSGRDETRDGDNYRDLNSAVANA